MNDLDNITQVEYDNMTMDRFDLDMRRFKINNNITAYPPFRGFFIGGCYHGKDIIMYKKYQEGDSYCIPILDDFSYEYASGINPDTIADNLTKVHEYELVSVRNLEAESKFFNINLDSLKKLYRCEKEILIYRLRRR